MPTKKSQTIGLNPDVIKVFSHTEVGTLIEDVNSNLKILAEGQQAIDQKIDRIAAKQEVHDHRLERLEIRVDTIEVHHTN